MVKGLNKYLKYHKRRALKQAATRKVPLTEDGGIVQCRQGKRFVTNFKYDRRRLLK